MFQNARIQLTAWYLLIIMFISLSFSLVIYKSFTAEITRLSRAQQLRLERRLVEGNYLAPQFRLHLEAPPLPIADPELVDTVKHRLSFILLLINCGILFLSGALGYFLAGRTLKPIQAMIEDQNRFISDSSHELRTPLTSLKSAMEVALRNKKLTLEEAKTLISDNIDDVNKLQSLSDELLHIAQFQKQKTAFKSQKLNILPILRSAVIQVAPLAKQKHISLKNTVRNSDLNGVKTNLEEVFVIIIDNAIKYSPNGSTITISSQKSDRWLEVSIKDQGIGISQKDLPHIFDRFYRADAARSKAVSNGYGLGLSIAKRIVDLHHGKITVSSKPQEGSIFTIKLPC